MGAFKPKNVATSITAYVVRGYIDKALSTDRWDRRFIDPGSEVIEGFGTVRIAEAPERPDDDGYGDRGTVIVVQVDREGASEPVYYRVDATMDSYGNDIRLESEPYEVVPKEVQVTRFERP